MAATDQPREWQPKDIRKQAEQRTPKSPVDVSQMLAEEIRKSLYELEVHQEELKIQNEELRRLQLQLQSSRDHLADLYDFAPVGYATVDAHGVIISANLATATMLGRERARIVGTQLVQYCDPGSRIELRDHFKKVLSSDMSHSSEVKFATPLGATFDARLVSNRIFTSDAGGDRNCRVIITDISSDKAAESKLRQSEERYRRLVNNSPFCIYEFELDGTVSAVNPAGLKMAGLSDISEVRGAGFLSRVHEEDKPRVAELFGRAKHGEISHFEVGSERGQIYETCFVPEIDDTGEVRRIMCIAQDISDRKQAEESLRKSENFFRTIFEQAAVGVAQLDSASGVILKLNRTCSEILNTPAEKLLGKTWMELTHPDDVDFHLMNMRRLRAGTIREFSMAQRLERETGSYVWSNLTVSPMWHPGDQPTTHIAIVQDITGRMRAEESLRQRDQAFRTTITPILFGDLEGRITDANQAFAELLGFDNVESLIGKQNTDFQSTPISVAQINKIVADAGEFNGEITIAGRDGKALEIQLTATLFNDADGQPIGSMATFMDVTPRRQVERALRESEQRTRTLVEAAPEAIVVFDVDEWRFVDVNENAVKLFGLERKRLLESGPIELSPETQPDGGTSAKTAMNVVRRALDGERPVFEWMHLDSKGNEIPCEVRLVRLPSSRRLIRGSITDITERIELRNALSRRAFEAELLYRAVAMADEVDSLESALQKCIDIVCELTSWPVGHVYVPSPSGAQQLEPTKIWRIADEQRFAKFREVSERTRFGRGEGLPGRIWSTLESAWIENMQEDKTFLRDARCEDLAVKGAFGFPIGINGETAAILEFFNDEEVARNETLLLLIRSVGEQVSRVIERKLAEEALRQSDEQLRELNASLEQRVAERTAELAETNAELAAFAHTVSHDLRSPLRAMEGFATALEEDYGEQLDERGHEFIQHIVASAQRMDELIIDLLKYSRLGRAKLPISPIRLDFVANQALEQLSKDCESSGTKVIVAERMATILGHGSTLVQIVTNLVSNAMKFVAPGVQPEVRVWTETQSKGWIRLYVEDNGIGIDVEYQSRVFQVFERLHGVESYPGTGIGLAIVARACERLGGRCGVESQLNQGSRFWVEFPEGEAVG